jgi:MFS family permease
MTARRYGMKNRINNKSDFKGSFFYGWVIIAIAALTLFFSGPGQTYSISVFINEYIKRFGWSRSLISSLYSFATLIAGLILPIVGRKIDKTGHRKMIVIISSLLGITCLWMSFVFNPVMLFIGFVFLRLLGQGSMTLIPSTLVSQWFVRRRGFAVSIMALGGVLSSAALPLINNWLIVNAGVQVTWRVWALLLVIVMAPVGWFLVRNKPENMGLVPDGKAYVDKKEKDNKPSNIVHATVDWTVKEAMRTRAFWLMLFCMMIPSMINTGITFHMVSIIEDKGLTAVFAATILSVIAAVQMPVKFLAGYSVDRGKVHYIKGIGYIVYLIGLLILLYGQSTTVLLYYGVITAVFAAFDSVSTEVLWPNYFGRKHLGSIRSIATTAMVIGSSLGPLPFGYAYDIFGGYKQILIIMMIFPVLGCIAAFSSPPPKLKRLNNADSSLTKEEYNVIKKTS